MSETGRQRLGRVDRGLVYHIVDTGDVSLCGVRLTKILSVEESYSKHRWGICGTCRAERDYRRLLDLVARYCQEGHELQ